MAIKAVLILCAQALFIQSAFSQCCGCTGLAGNGWAFDGLAYDGLVGRGWGYDGLAYDGLAGRGWGYDGLAYDGLAGRGWAGLGSPGLEITSTSGGGLPVASGSAFPPVGVSVASNNVYEGILCAAGELPFVGTVGVDGVLPTAGAGAINYGCGNGVTAMAASDIAGPGIGYGAGILGYDVGNIGYDAGNIGYGAGNIGYGAGWAGRGCGCGGIL